MAQGIVRAARIVRAPVALLVVGLAWLVRIPSALAQTKTIAVYVDGPNAAPLREAAVRVVRAVADVADDEWFRAQLARQGQKKPFTKELDATTIDRIRTAGRATGAVAVLVVREGRFGKSRTVSLTVVDIAEGASPAINVRLDPKSHRADGDTIASALGHSLDKYAPPEPAPPAPDLASVHEPPPLPAAPPRLAPAPVPAPKTPAQLTATSLFDVAIGAGVAGRRFAYANGISPSPFLYSVFPTRTAGFVIKVFPLRAAGGIWRDIGIAGDYSLALLQRSDWQGALSSAMPTSHSFSLCARIHPEADARILVGACLGYAYTSYGTVGPPARELPDVAYRSVRPALDARIAFGSVSFVAAAAFRAIIDASSIAPTFYNARGYGIDAEVGGALMFVRRLEARIVFRYERYSFSFTPPPGATFAAGEALDQQYGARLSIAFVF